jgi:anti-sigma factor RsiW
MNPTTITDDDVTALADGQLAVERRALVEAAVGRDAALAARVAEIRAQNALLRDAFDPWLAEAVPPRLVDAAVPPKSPAGRAWVRAWPAVAVAATLVLGVATGWIGRGVMLELGGTPTTFARQAAYTHALYSADQRRPVEVWANEEASLVRWLSRRLGYQAHVPNLASIGYALVGGRLVAGNEKPTALVMYENAEKQRLTLQWRVAKGRSGETEFRYAHEDGVGVFYWIDDDCAYALSGPLDRAKLLQVAHVVYGQIMAADRAATPSAAPPPAAPGAPATTLPGPAGSPAEPAKPTITG